MIQKQTQPWEHTDIDGMRLFLELNKTNKSSSHEQRRLPFEINPDKMPQRSFPPWINTCHQCVPFKSKDSKSVNISGTIWELFLTRML